MGGTLSQEEKDRQDRLQEEFISKLVEIYVLYKLEQELRLLEKAEAEERERQSKERERQEEERRLQREADEQERKRKKKAQDDAWRSRVISNYHKSPETPIKSLVEDLKKEPRDLLKRGDILSRLCDRSGSYSGGGGLGIHYLIYIDYNWSTKKHEIIEKLNPGGDQYCIERNYISDSEMRNKYHLVTDEDCRRSTTADMAERILNEELDAGYSFTHANCEHFVTFCLTWSTEYCRSRQALALTTARDVVGSVISTPIALAKVVSHPFYLIGGDMTLTERCIKAQLPLEFLSVGEKVARGQLILIGDAVLRDERKFWWDLPF